MQVVETVNAGGGFLADAPDRVALTGEPSRRFGHALADLGKQRLFLFAGGGVDQFRLARLDPVQPFGIGLDQPRFHVVDGRDGAAHLVQQAQFAARAILQLVHLPLDGRVAVEQILVFQQVGLVGQDLLHPKRPLLIPGPGQAKRLVPGGQLHGARPRGL